MSWKDFRPGPVPLSSGFYQPALDLDAGLTASAFPQLFVYLVPKKAAGEGGHPCPSRLCEEGKEERLKAEGAGACGVPCD